MELICNHFYEFYAISRVFFNWNHPTFPVCLQTKTHVKNFSKAEKIN